MSMGKNLEALRLAFGHSYADIATAVGTEPQQIHYLVANDSQRSKYAPAIARWYSVTLDALTSGDTEEVMRMAVRPFSAHAPVRVDEDVTGKNGLKRLSPEGLQIVKLFDELTPVGKDLAAKILLSIAEHHAASAEQPRSVSRIPSSIAAPVKGKVRIHGPSNVPLPVSKSRSRRNS